MRLAQYGLRGGGEGELDLERQAHTSRSPAVTRGAIYPPLSGRLERVLVIGGFFHFGNEDSVDWKGLDTLLGQEQASRARGAAILAVARGFIRGKKSV